MKWAYLRPSLGESDDGDVAGVLAIKHSEAEQNCIFNCDETGKNHQNQSRCDVTDEVTRRKIGIDRLSTTSAQRH